MLAPAIRVTGWQPFLRARSLAVGLFYSNPKQTLIMRTMCILVSRILQDFAAAPRTLLDALMLIIPLHCKITLLTKTPISMRSNHLVYSNHIDTAVVSAHSMCFSIARSGGAEVCSRLFLEFASTLSYVVVSSPQSRSTLSKAASRWVYDVQLLPEASPDTWRSPPGSGPGRRGKLHDCLLCMLDHCAFDESCAKL